MAHYDIIGNIAIIKFDRKTGLKEKKQFAANFLKKYPYIKTVLEKSQKFRGRLRTQKTKYLAGDRTKEALYRENNCIFRLNVDKCYFSPRLASERKEVALLTKKGENVLVMFGGIAPFAIVIGKLSKAEKIISVELSKACSKYAEENVRRNKLQERVEVIQGDVRKVAPTLRKKFNRIVMPRPQLKDSFLDAAFKVSKTGTIIHYYGFYPDGEKHKLIEVIDREAKKARRKIKILKVKKAGEVGVRRFRWRADLKIV